MSELTARSEDSAKDNALRRDVRSLGALLGRVLVEQVGPELLEAVEQLRRLMIQHREHVRRNPAAGAQGGLMAKAQAMIAEMDITRAYQVSKAFSIYFELTNLAETTIIGNAAAGPANWSNKVYRCREVFTERCCG